MLYAVRNVNVQNNGVYYVYKKLLNDSLWYNKSVLLTMYMYMYIYMYIYYVLLIWVRLSELQLARRFVHVPYSLAVTPPPPPPPPFETYFLEKRRGRGHNSEYIAFPRLAVTLFHK